MTAHELAERIRKAAGLEAKVATGSFADFSNKANRPREVVELTVDQAERVASLLEHGQKLRAQDLEAAR